MRVLWLCNLVIPELAGEFNIKKTVMGGWISGMCKEIEKDSDIELAICVPIIDSSRFKDGKKGKLQYYSFASVFEDTVYAKKGKVLEERFDFIIKEFQPDVIHIWGTEYLHSLAMLRAAEMNGLRMSTLVSIQGLVSVCATHYLRDIPDVYKTMRIEGYRTLEEEERDFAERGNNEISLIKETGHIIGRTLWDKACTWVIQPNRNYYECGESLRAQFYAHAGEWGKDYIRYRIFMSQGSYPIKGIHYMLEALEILAKTYPQVQLCIAGNNILQEEILSPYAAYINDRAEAMNIKDKIKYLGMLDAEEMINEYKKSNVYVLSSTLENSPNSLCEAMMLGVPVVASAVGGVTEIIRNEQEGLLYQYDDPNVLAYQIARVFEGQVDVTQLSMCECKRAGEFNNRENNIHMLKQIYQKVKKL